MAPVASDDYRKPFSYHSLASWEIAERNDSLAPEGSRFDLVPQSVLE